MASNFRETILKLLSATNYSLDNLSSNQISSFENLPHLKPMFEWLSQSLSEANCITPEEMEEFKKLQLNDRVKYGDELEEAIQAYSYRDEHSSVPFKESLNDAEQELTLLREQFHYKQALHEALCSSNAAAANDIRELKSKQQKAEVKQKQVIKEICSVKKMLKDNISEVQAVINEIHNDVIGLVQNAGSPDVSSDEEIHSLTSETRNKSLSTSVWSLATTSSWQTIRGNDSTAKYMCQLSFDGYQRMHKQFLKRLTRLLENLSKSGRFQSNSLDFMDLHTIKDRLEKQMFTLIEKEAELEGIRAARVKVKELHKIVHTGECLENRLEWEQKEVENRMEEESFNLIDKEELSTACRQWAEFKALEAFEHKVVERKEYSKCLIEKMDELLNPLILKLNADKILLEVLRYEKERIEMSIELYKSFHQSLQIQFDQMKKRIESMQNNLQDYNQFCTLPLEERNDLVEQLASIIFCDNADLVQAVQNLTESSQREYETMFEHYNKEKNELVISCKNMEESCKVALSRNISNEEAPSEVVGSIQRALDQINSVIDDMTNDIREASNQKI